MRGYYGGSPHPMAGAEGAQGAQGWDPNQPDDVKWCGPPPLPMPPVATQPEPATTSAFDLGTPYNTAAWKTTFAVASVASAALCTFHGYRRNDSVGWALGWGALGALFPVVTPALALAQGFGKPK